MKEKGYFMLLYFEYLMSYAVVASEMDGRTMVLLVNNTSKKINAMKYPWKP